MGASKSKQRSLVAKGTEYSLGKKSDTSLSIITVGDQRYALYGETHEPLGEATDPSKAREGFINFMRDETKACAEDDSIDFFMEASFDMDLTSPEFSKYAPSNTTDAVLTQIHKMPDCARIKFFAIDPRPALFRELNINMDVWLDIMGEERYRISLVQEVNNMSGWIQNLVSLSLRGLGAPETKILESWMHGFKRDFDSFNEDIWKDPIEKIKLDSWFLAARTFNGFMLCKMFTSRAKTRVLFAGENHTSGMRKALLSLPGAKEELQILQDGVSTAFEASYW